MISPAAANPEVIPAAESPTTEPNPYKAAKEPTPPMPAPSAPANTSEIALSRIVLFLSLTAAAASFTTLTID